MSYRVLLRLEQRQVAMLGWGEIAAAGNLNMPGFDKRVQQLAAIMHQQRSSSSHSVAEILV